MLAIAEKFRKLPNIVTWTRKRESHFLTKSGPLEQKLDRQLLIG